MCFNKNQLFVFTVMVYTSGLQGVYWCTLVYMIFFKGCIENLVKWKTVFKITLVWLISMEKIIIITYNKRF